MDMGRMKFVATAVFFSCCVVMPGAQRLDSARQAIDTYRAAIQSAQQAPSQGRLEAAFGAIGPLREALLRSADGRYTLESLSEQEFTTLSRELVGLIVNRDEIVFVEPDVTFFRRLAARGDRADRAFFAALSSTYPESVWPVYIEQQTDYGGCTRFGSGTLVSTYFTWAAVRRQYPKRYGEATASHLNDIVNELTGRRVPVVIAPRLNESSPSSVDGRQLPTYERESRRAWLPFGAIVRTFASPVHPGSRLTPAAHDAAASLWST